MKASFLTGTLSAKCEEYTSLFNHHLPKVNHHLPKLINCWSSALVPVQIMSYQPEFSHLTHHLPRFNHCLPKNSHWQLKNTNLMYMYNYTTNPNLSKCNPQLPNLNPHLQKNYSLTLQVQPSSTQNSYLPKLICIIKIY